MKEFSLTKTTMLIAILLSSYGGILRSQNSMQQDFEEAFGFGKYLYLEKDYSRAIGEFKKALHLNSLACLNKSDSLNYLLGDSYFRLSDYPLSNRYLFDISNKHSSLYNKAMIQIGKNYILNGSADTAVAFIRGVRNSFVSEACSEKLSQLLVAGHLSLNNHQLASATLVETGLQDKKLSQIVSEQRNFHPKSPVVAGMLSSVVPGAGKVYAGNLDDGLMSMFTIGLLGFRAFIEYKRDGIGSVNFLAFSLISLYFYVGNVFGSVVSAKQFNQRHHHDIQVNIIDFVHEIE